jgi:hypothetical protein
MPVRCVGISCRTPGGVNEIIGILTTWSPALDRFMGPRLEEFESFVQTAL